MSNIPNIYNKQVYRNNIISQNAMINGSNSYGQSYQHHPIYRNKNQVLDYRGVQYLHFNLVQQITTYPQVAYIPQFQ